jgi:hypothetical protein
VISAGGIVSGFAKDNEPSQAQLNKQLPMNRGSQTGARVSAQQILSKKMRAAVRAVMSWSTRTRDRRCRSSAHPYAAELYGVSSCERLAGADMNAPA